MAEVEFGGVKFTGGKMFALITALSTLGGAAWGGFEFYNDYRNMKSQITEYVAPDLSGLENQMTVLNGKMDNIDNEFKALRQIDDAMEDTIRTEVNGIKDKVDDVLDNVRDVKDELKIDLEKMEKSMDRQDERNRDNVNTVRSIINSFEERTDRKMETLDSKIEDLETKLDRKIVEALNNPLNNR